MPRAGVHYPGNYAAMRAWFPDDAACRDYLDWLRWPEGWSRNPSTLALPPAERPWRHSNLN